MDKRVIVGMSGGVDSSVTAYILKEQGYEVIGVTMQVWQDEEREQIEDCGGCCGLSAVDDARTVSDMLDIPYYILNFKKEFKENVIDYFIREYISGRTPNPCIACNRYVKWESLLSKAVQLGADYIATGHYGKIVTHPETGRYTLQKSLTNGKDQTYALYNLTQYQLAHTLMPLGDYTKDEVRAIAVKIGLYVANKPDSQEICFIPDNDYGSFIQKQSEFGQAPGEFVDTCGEVLGKHKGIANYTIGQRKGLGVSFGRPLYVKAIDVENNRVVLADNKELFSDELKADNLSFMSIDALKGERAVKAQIRYGHKPADCIIRPEGNKIICKFKEPQRAITPGQAVAFYENNYVLGGGVIAGN